MLESSSTLPLDLWKFIEDVVDCVGGVLAAKRRVWTWCVRSCNSFSNSGSRHDTEFVQEIVGELMVDGCACQLPDFAAA